MHSCKNLPVKTDNFFVMSEEIELSVLRDQIDALDQNIQQLINERAKCAQNVAYVKEKYANGEAIQFYRPEREAQVLRKVMARNEGPIANEDMARLFREIMSVCLALEEPLKVAFLGQPRWYTEPWFGTWRPAKWTEEKPLADLLSKSPQ